MLHLCHREQSAEAEALVSGNAVMRVCHVLWSSNPTACNDASASMQTKLASLAEPWQELLKGSQAWHDSCVRELGTAECPFCGAQSLSRTRCAVPEAAWSVSLRDRVLLNSTNALLSNVATSRCARPVPELQCFTTG